MLEKYESKQQQILKPAGVIYAALSDFNNFTPLVADKVEGWAVDGNSCSFKVKGFPMSLRMVEKIPDRLIKIEASDSSPFGFTFWVQMKEIGTAAESDDAKICDDDASKDTRLRLVLHAEMNMMIKMMLGSKIQPSLDSMAAQIAGAFNSI